MLKSKGQGEKAPATSIESDGGRKNSQNFVDTEELE